MEIFPKLQKQAFFANVYSYIGKKSSKQMRNIFCWIISKEGEGSSQLLDLHLKSF